HLSSEVQNYFTRYLASIKGRIAVLVTFSAHKQFYTKYSQDFFKAVSTLRVIETAPGQYAVQTERSTRIHEVAFAGLRAISESEARGFFAVSANDVLNQDALIAGAEKLRQQYNQLGFRNASIDIEIPPRGEGSVDVKVTVKEAVQTLIDGIQFSSQNQELNKYLSSRIARRKGNALTDAELAEVLKRVRDSLSGQGYVRTEITGPDISFNADESKAQLTFKLDKVDSYSIDFSGNKDVSSSSLTSALNLNSYYSASSNVGSELAAKVKNIYLARGFARVEVQSEETDGRKPNSRKILLNIEEGPKIKISKFEFSGNISRDGKYYTKILKKHGSDIIQREYYNKEELDISFKALAIELQNEGYLLAKINSTRTQYNKEKNQVAVFVNIDEGPLTQITGIEFNGNTSIPSADLLRVVDLSDQSALRLEALDRAIANLKIYYQERGYIEMALLNDKEDLVVYNEDNTRAHLIFKIYEGPSVKVANIALDGNTFTKDHVLLKVIDLQPGDTVTPGKIEEAKAKLQRTGYFNT
ncbi:MAG: outer membrane protein assembly factor, partial [Proteobacteria bacterium]